MPTFLLTGAGFSYNWGGWLAEEIFEYLIGCPELDADLRATLWANKKIGFERLLEILRSAASTGNTDDKKRLAVYENMLLSMFNTMNNSFANVQFNAAFDPHSLGYPTDYIRYFLASFDAIYTLNQDTLIEQKYNVKDLHRLSSGRWQDMYCPGVEPVTVQGRQFEIPGVWKPQTGPLKDELHRQPYFKLHGSSNWRDGENSILIMGGDKTQSIESHPLLNAYKERFLADLSLPDTRLMIIGYSFRDPHINDAIYAGMKKGTELFIVDPEGVDVAMHAISFPNPSNPAAFENLLPFRILGGSRRSLISTFTTDHVERAKLMRFFTRGLPRQA